MANRYVKGVVPEEYDPRFFEAELLKLEAMLHSIEVPYIILAEQNSEPVKLIEGMVLKADGTNWNPGAGQGVYAYVGGAWVKL